MLARLTFLLVAAMASAGAARLLSVQRQANITLLQFERGGGEIEVISPSTFRFVYCRVAPCAGRPGAGADVAFRAADTVAAFEIHTSYLDIRVRKSDGGLAVTSRHGIELLDQIVAAGPAPAGIAFDHRAREGERFYGLGPRTDSDLDLRGKSVTTQRPFLISSAGFGLWFTATSTYTFDLAARAGDRVSIRAPYPDRLEFYFHYGPGPKEVLEEYFDAVGSPIQPTARHAAVLTDASLPRYAVKPPASLPLTDLLAWLAHASMSGIVAPALRQSVPPLPVESLFPLLYGGETSALRRSLQPYLFTYLIEAKDRGFPLFRPMAMQHSKDETAARRLDQFMLGDELLTGTGHDIYLPMGLWTDLQTGQQHRGKQVVPLTQTEGVPLFAKNGTIVPLLQPGGAVQLHYFPRLGAEFFLSEEGDSQPTQVHAGPAAGILRLEIESRVARDYEWVVHHVSPAAAIQPANPRSTYNATTRQLHIPVSAAALGDAIVNVTLEEPLEP